MDRWALDSALASLVQAEPLEQINARLRGIRQVLNAWPMKAAADGGR
jgi:hypothetical protein